MKQRIIHSPLGSLLLSACDGRIREIRLPRPEEKMQPCESDAVLDEAERQLKQYFSGERRTFDLPLDMEESAFDCAVWQQLLEIPFGQIRTYGQLAGQLGKPKASRAVGGACSRNPLLIVVPCHRVIAGTGRLSGFAAGLEMKRGLLALEGWDIQNDRVKGE